jgi:hypothetical protein
MPLVAVMSKTLLFHLPFKSNLRQLDAVQRFCLLRRCLHTRPTAESNTITNKVTIAKIASLDHDCSASTVLMGCDTKRSQHLETLLGNGTSGGRAKRSLYSEFASLMTELVSYLLSNFFTGMKKIDLILAKVIDAGSKQILDGSINRTDVFEDSCHQEVGFGLCAGAASSGKFVKDRGYIAQRKQQTQLRCRGPVDKSLNNWRISEDIGTGSSQVSTTVEMSLLVEDRMKKFVRLECSAYVW